MSQFEAVFDYENPGWIVVEWTQVDETTRRAEVYDRFTGTGAERNAIETAHILQEAFDDYEEFPSGEFPRQFVY